LTKTAIGVAFFVAALGLAMIVPLPGFFVMLTGSFLRGFGGGLIWVFSTQILLMSLPNRVRGRVFSTEFAVQTLMASFSAYLGGWGLDNLTSGIQGMLWIMTATCMFFGILWFMWVFFGPTKRQQKVVKI